MAGIHLDAGRQSTGVSLTLLIPGRRKLPGRVAIPKHGQCGEKCYVITFTLN